jgi:hypothetical protein
MILTEGARLKHEGKRGLVKLPGVDVLLNSVSKNRPSVFSAARRVLIV